MSIYSENMDSVNTPMLYWYAVHVKSRHEFKVVERLNKTDIDTFCPVVDRLSRWKDRKKIVRFSLFPGYLFVHVRKTYHSILAVLKTPGVVRLLGVNPEEPHPIPEEQILSLKKIIESNETIDPYPYLKEGQKIRINKGPLTGAEGILVKKSDHHRLVISIDILQRGVSLKIDVSDVEAIS